MWSSMPKDRRKLFLGVRRRGGHIAWCEFRKVYISEKRNIIIYVVCNLRRHKQLRREHATVVRSARQRIYARETSSGC